MTPNDIQTVQEANLLNFLLTAPNQLADKPSLVRNSDFTYCTLALTCNESISCVRWNGVCYMAGSDVVRIVAMRLASVGVREPDSKLLKRNVVSHLRTIKAGRGMLLEPANSPLLSLLFQHDLISTRKSQKLFWWYQVPHDQLFEHELAHYRCKAGLPPLRQTLPSTTAILDADYQADDRTRRFACGLDGCPRRLTRLEHAQRHRAAHLQEKPYKCGYCGQAFSRKDNATAHARRHDAAHRQNSKRMNPRERMVQKPHQQRLRPFHFPTGYGYDRSQSLLVPLLFSARPGST